MPNAVRAGWFIVIFSQCGKIVQSYKIGVVYWNLGPDNVLYVYEKRSHVMGTAQNSLDLNVVLKLFLIIPEIFGYIEVPIILFAPMKWRE